MKKQSALLLLPVLFFGCRPWIGGAPPANYREAGIASWYGTDFHGRRTSSGERYNMFSMTAAHRTLPLGTRAVVTSTQNGRRVEVRINDRGPFVKGRVIDLTYAAARKLGIAERGTGPVLIEAHVPGAAPASARPPATVTAAEAAPAAPPEAPTATLPGEYTVQIGSFGVRENAERLRERLLPEYGTVFIEPYEDDRGTFHRVRVGRLPSEEAADRAARALQDRGFTAFVVRLD